MTTGSSLSIPLTDLQRPWSLFATALGGTPLALRGANRSAARWLGTPRDATAIDLPEQLPVVSSIRDTLGAARVDVLRHVIDVQEGGRWHFELPLAKAGGLLGPCDIKLSSAADLDKCVASWPWPVLLRRIFAIVDGGRVDAVIYHRFPGAREELGRSRARLLDGRPQSSWRRPIAAGVEALLQFSLGATACSPGGGENEEEMRDLAWPARASNATVYDSLRAAIDICALLARGGGRDRRCRALRSEALATLVASYVNGALSGASDSGNGSEAGSDWAAPARENQTGGALRALVPSRRAHPEPEPARTSTVADDGAQMPTQTASARQPEMGGAIRAAGAIRTCRYYNEWDYRNQRYLHAWTCVRERRLYGTDQAYLSELRRRHDGLVRRIRQRFSAARPEARERLGHAIDGEIDLDRAVEAVLERRAGRHGDDRVYTMVGRSRRDVCAALLMDMSGSTGFLIPDSTEASGDPSRQVEEDDDLFFYSARLLNGSVNLPRRRVIDLTKEAIGLMCEGLDRLGDRHAVFGFSGQGRERVDFWVAKTFDERWSVQTAASLAEMQPSGATRTGAAVRHAVARLAREPERTKVLIIVSDGYPQDSDYGPESRDIEYGLHDTARSLREAERAGVSTFCVTVDRAAHDYLRKMCPERQYLVIHDVAQLPEKLVKLYRALTSR